MLYGTDALYLLSCVYCSSSVEVSVVMFACLYLVVLELSDDCRYSRWVAHSFYCRVWCYVVLYVFCSGIQVGESACLSVFQLCCGVTGASTRNTCKSFAGQLNFNTL